jgi:type IV pilus assembly protein PilQ
MKNRDVKISSVFFSVDVVRSLNAGINWSFLYNDTTRRSVQLGGDFSSGIIDPKNQQQGSSSAAQQVQAPGFLGRVVPTVNFTNISALVSFFQSHKLGDVISSPQVVVSSGKDGKIQVGQDFYIATRDFAGNTVNQVQSTGIIITVKPTVYEERGLRFINLDITAENSTIASAGASPIINKSSVKTTSVLYDGEETVIGGLYTTTENTERAGIPFLKDLPWYIFGLRYIFGYDNTSSAKNELIILLKAEIIPTLEERVADKMKRQDNLIEKMREEFDRDIEKHKIKR